MRLVCYMRFLISFAIVMSLAACGGGNSSVVSDYDPYEMSDFVYSDEGNVSGTFEQLDDYEMSDSLYPVETNMTRAHARGEVNMYDFRPVDGLILKDLEADLQTDDGRYVIKKQSDELVEVIFDSKTIKSYRNFAVSIKNFRVVGERFVVYLLYLDDNVRNVVFDMDLGVEYKLDSIGSYGEIFYDETVQKLLVCDDSRIRRVGNLQIVDLRFGSIDSIHSRDVYINDSVIVSCDGFDEDSKEYVFSLVSVEDSPDLHVIERNSIENAWSSSVVLGYEQDLEQFIPEQKLSLEQRVQRFFDLLNMNRFDFAYEMIAEKQMTKDDFDLKFGFNELNKVLVINQVDGDMFEAIVKIVSFDKDLDVFDSVVWSMVWSFDSDKKMQMHNNEIVESQLIEDFADGRIEHFVVDGQQQVLLDGEIVYATCNSGGSAVCNYSLISEFEFVTDNIFKFSVSHYEGKETYLINLNTSKVSDGLFLFDYKNKVDPQSTLFIENKLIHCRDSDAFDAGLFVMDLDTMEIEKRYEPQGEYFGVVCLGFDYDRRAFRYKVYSGEQLEEFSYNKTQDFFDGLELKFFDLD